MRRKISALMLSMVLSAGCSTDSNSPAAPSGPGTGAPQSNGPFTISLSTTPGRPGFVEDDTLTVTASVVDKAGVSVPAPTLKWFGPLLSESKAVNAVYVLKPGDNYLGAGFVQNGVTVASASLHLSAVARPGEMLIWSPGGAVVRITAPAGAYRISPTAMNDRGEIIGTISYTDADDKHGFIWSESTGFTELKSPEGGVAVPTGINENGAIGGYTGDGLRSASPFIWSRSVGLSVIPDTARLTVVTSINAQGHLAGYRNNKPFLWTRETGFVSYAGAGDRPPGYDFSTVIALNDHDDMLASWVGTFSDGIDYGFADYEYPTILNGVRKDDFECTPCRLSAMNNNREIAGMSYRKSYRAIRWTPQAGVTLLPLGDYDGSVGLAINESGNVGGWVSSFLPKAVRRAAVWGSSDLIVLDTPAGITKTEARDINRLGLVLVYAR
ncbi:MAG: hypothetical protein ABIZ36_06285 [Gemmatimonadaceae bacterium]